MPLNMFVKQQQVYVLTQAYEHFKIELQVAITSFQNAMQPETAKTVDFISSIECVGEQVCCKPSNNRLKN
jgi:hypothetical protein